MGPPRLRGEGWEAWREGDVVHTRATDTQHAVSAGARMDALARLLREGGMGIVMDERRAGGPPSPGAIDTYRDFLRMHRVPIAIVARGPAPDASVEDLRRAVPRVRIATFTEPQRALEWLRAVLKQP